MNPEGLWFSRLTLVMILGVSKNLVAQIAFAGSIGSAGGRAVVCLNHDDKTIASAESLDTFEGRVAFSDRHLSLLPKNFPVDVGGGKVLPLDADSVDSILAIAKARLSRTAYTLWTGEVRYDEAVDLVAQRMRFVAEDSGLQPVEDSFEVVAAPPGCVIAQAVVFLDPNNILVDARIWAALKPFDRAAIIVHETLYWLDRIEAGAVDSRFSRRAVSRILSATWTTEGTFEGLPRNYVMCLSYKEPAGTGKRTVLAFYTAGANTMVRVGMINGQRSLDLTESAVLGRFPFDLRSNVSAQGSELVLMAPRSAWTPVTHLALNISAEPGLGGALVRVFRLSGEQEQYPDWTLNNQQLTCYPVQTR